MNAGTGTRPKTPVHPKGGSLYALTDQARRYAAAKATMTEAAEAATKAEARLLDPKAVVKPDGPERVAEISALSEAVVEAERVFAPALAEWRDALIGLQRAALSLGGGFATLSLSRPASRLVGAGQAYAEAKRAVDSHAPPFAGPAYAAILTAWRGALSDLDLAAIRYASAAPPTTSSEKS